MARALTPFLALWPAAAAAQTPPPADPTVVKLSGEYRVRTQYIDPLELSGTRVQAIDSTEMRLRVAADLKHEEWLTLHTRWDFLDGVLFGDNGRFGGDPSANTGVALAARRPNNTILTVGLDDGADPVSRDSYVPRLKGVDVVQLDFAYVDAILPVGLLRVGRQPSSPGASLGGHEGDRVNRWGVSSYADTADRFLFATKIDEAVRLATTPGHKIDTSIDRGVFFITWIDLFNQGSVIETGDALLQQGVSLLWRDPDLAGTVRDFLATTNVVHLGGDDARTDIWAFPFRTSGKLPFMHFLFNSVVITGESLEIAQGLAALSQKKPQLQEVSGIGMQGVLDFPVGPITLTAEVDYASGDADPRPTNPITVYSYPRDLNVGLLLFERILAFQTARAAAVGIENLRALDTESFPLTEVSTEGRFTNAIALFPQLKWDFLDTARHHLHGRFGALMAFADEPVVDPVQTILAEDGQEISDDAVNFEGGKPARYYGTELDVQLQWGYRGAFYWTVEGAYLMPGEALQDEHGAAVSSFQIENRLEYLF